MWTISRRTTVISGALVTLVLVLVSSYLLMAIQSPDSEPWPSFTMTYEDIGFYSDGAEERHVRRTQMLAYAARRDWKATVIRTEPETVEILSRQASFVGSWLALDGDTLTVYDSVTDETRTERVGPDDFDLPPAFGSRCLTPGSLPKDRTPELTTADPIVCFPDCADSRVSPALRYHLPDCGLTIFLDDERGIPIFLGSSGLVVQEIKVDDEPLRVLSDAPT